MKFKKCAAVLALTAIFACNKKEKVENGELEKTPTAVETSAPAIKVYVAADGKITADGQPTTLEKLDQEFAQFPKDGVVYFSRANSQEDAPIESMQVIETVVKYGLGIQFYTDSTFTRTADMGNAQ